MRAFDELLILQTEKNLSGIDDLDLIEMSPETYDELVSDYHNEFGIQNSTPQELSEWIGAKIFVNSYDARRRKSRQGSQFPRFRIFKEL